MNQEGEQREFLFNDTDFQQIRKMVYAQAGINLTERKRDMVYSRLSRRLRATGHRTFKEYLAFLENNGEDERLAFVNALTTNLTSFFREPHHFPILAEHLLSLNKRPIRLWCSASSTGEEAYTIAMTVVDAFGSFDPPVQIVATDIDTNVLNTAQAGIYSLQRLEKLPRENLNRFFLRGKGQREGYARVRKELRDLVNFRQLNLLDAHWSVNGPFDAIFCRNVMIYFDKPTQYQIFDRFATLLEPHGLLFAGHSESLHFASDLFKLHGKTVYGLSQQARGVPSDRVRPPILQPSKPSMVR